MDRYLEPETSIFEWLFQLDDLDSLHEQCLFHHFHPFLNWLFGVPGIYSLIMCDKI